MPRAAKVDKQETLLRLNEGSLVDGRSFVSIDGHEYLKGDDMSRRRREVFERDSYACQAPIMFNGLKCGRLVTWETGELDHIQGGLVGRHDDMSNLRTICRTCHRAKHVHTRFGEHK